MKKNYHFKCQRLLALLFAFLIAIVAAVPANAQNLTVKGKVVSSEDKLPLPGVGVKVKGSSTGTTTDVEGNFTIPGKVGDVLVFSFIGFKEKQVTVSNSNTITVRLETDVANLEEVVVIGYGVQKKKLTTGANLQVKGEDIQEQNTTSALQALQGQAPGVQITSNSGQPGAGINVIVRGKGTIGNSGPLYVIDGIVGADINNVNPADIESIDVLKDAASAAIYGAQGGNGVILVTTKTGKVGQRPSITFNAYSGVQQVARQAPLLNAREYATIYNESMVNSGKAPVFTNDSIARMGTGTNWLDQMFVKNAATQNYVLGADGGNDASVYSASLSYTGQEGIVGGEDHSNYKRYGLKLNTEHKLYKDLLKIGQHLNFVAGQNNGVAIGGVYFNTLRGAFTTSPLLNMYDNNGNFINTATAPNVWNNAEANPYASMVYNNQNRNNNQNLVGDLYAVIEPIKGLSFRTSLGLQTGSSDYRSFTPNYELSIYSFNRSTSVNQSLSRYRTLQFDNFLSYKFDMGEQAHNFEVMAGTSAISRKGVSMSGNNRDLIFPDFAHAYLTNATNRDGTALGLSGSPWESSQLSYFGRMQYNYKEKYLFNATFRADGSSNFAKGNQWGYFPSVSAGWVLTNESFLQNNKALDYLKLRLSYGQVGNQNIGGDFFNAPILFTNALYSFGPTEGINQTGAYPQRLGNPDIKWETSEQTNIGFDSRLLNNKLNLNFDYYVKTTKDWLIQPPVLATAGAEPPMINGGDVKNSGIELALTYNNNAGDFSYSVGINGAYNKNKIGEIPVPGGTIIGSGAAFDNSGSFYRAQNGMPVGYFFGLQTNGIFQNEAEINSYRSASGALIQPGVAPGDVRYVDLSGNGIIDDADYTMIGDPNPDYTFGLNLSAGYKGFDISVLASGVMGNQIFQAWRMPGSSKSNWSAEILNRWHGDGTSNKIPRVTEDGRNWAKISDLYIHDGDYLRINNLTLGYDLSQVVKRNYLSKVRLYVSALNLYTFTKYNGMDPEVGYGEGFSSGTDFGYYPRPRTYLVGLNVKF